MSNIGNKETFGKNLLYYLKRSGKDQKMVAEILGVAPSTFNEWIKGKKYPRMDKVEMLANYFGILKSDLIEEKSEVERTPPKDHISEGEQLLLDLFRKIPEDQQQLVLQMIRAALSAQEQ